MGFFGKSLSQRLVRWPSQTGAGVRLPDWQGVRTLLEQDWMKRQPAVLGASALLTALLFGAGVHLERLPALAALGCLSLPVAILLVSGE